MFSHFKITVIPISVCSGCGFKTLLEFCRSCKDEPMLSTFSVVHRCIPLAWIQIASCFCFYLQEFKRRYFPWYVACLLHKSRYVPLFLLVACFAAAVIGFSPIRSKTSGLLLIIALGFVLKLFVLLKEKWGFTAVFGALHTLKKEQNFALLCLYDGFWLYRSQITSQSS